MKYKILAFDIDGTLTNSKKEITPATKQAIWDAAKAGCTIVIASGRPIQGIRRYEEELRLREIGGYILGLNGGRIIECATQRVLRNVMVPMEYYDEICDLAKAQDVHLMTYEGDDIISETLEDPYLKIEGRINGLGGRHIDDLKSYLDFPVNKFLMLAEGEYLGKVEVKVSEAFKGRLEVYRSEPFFLEILPKGVNKATSLEFLLQELGYTRDELMAFGDGYNDLTMIQYAGMGIAMENGMDCVKAAADCIAPNNNEDGIAYILHKFVID